MPKSSWICIWLVANIFWFAGCGLQEKVEQSEDAIDDLKTEIDDLKTEIDDLKQELNDSMEVVKTLHEKYKSLNSWKLYLLVGLEIIAIFALIALLWWFPGRGIKRVLFFIAIKKLKPRARRIVATSKIPNSADFVNLQVIQKVNSLDVDLAENEVMYIRERSFSKHPTDPQQLTVPNKFRMPISRLFKRFYWVFKVVGQQFTVGISNDYGNPRIIEFDIPENDFLIIKLDHLLGYSTAGFPIGKWKPDLVSLLTRQLRYVYLSGPCRIICLGLGEVDIKDISAKDKTASHDKANVIGWTNGLSHGIGTKATMLSAFLEAEEISLDQFEGEGQVILQTSKLRPNISSNLKGKNMFWDYISALLGLSV
jgi:hypothetical protein